MAVFFRLLFLWVSVTVSAHLALSYFWQGLVAQKTLAIGTEPNSIKFLGMLVAFGMSAYYFWCEMGEWKTEMLWKTIVGTLAVVGFLGGITSLERLDQTHYNAQAEYQINLIAECLDTTPDQLFGDYVKTIPEGTRREDVKPFFPGSLVSDLVERRDETAYQDFLYWLGPGTLPVGAHISFSTAPHRVTAVEPLPRLRKVPTGADGGRLSFEAAETGGNGG